MPHRIEAYPPRIKRNPSMDAPITLGRIRASAPRSSCRPASSRRAADGMPVPRRRPPRSAHGARPAVDGHLQRLRRRMRPPAAPGPGPRAGSVTTGRSGGAGGADGRSAGPTVGSTIRRFDTGPVDTASAGRHGPVARKEPRTVACARRRLAGFGSGRCLQSRISHDTL